MKVIKKEKKPPAQMTIQELLAYVREIETENKRLEESFQRATGAIAADALPTFAEMRKVSEMCKSNKSCSGCEYRFEDKYGLYECIFGDEPADWQFGGADNGR